MGLEVAKMELEMKDISGSKFKEVNAEGLDFDNVTYQSLRLIMQI